MSESVSRFCYALLKLWFCDNLDRQEAEFRQSLQNPSVCLCGYTSLQDATARCRGVSHLLSLAFTLAPTSQAKHE